MLPKSISQFQHRLADAIVKEDVVQMDVSMSEGEWCLEHHAHQVLVLALELVSPRKDGIIHVAKASAKGFKARLRNQADGRTAIPKWSRGEAHIRPAASWAPPPQRMERKLISCIRCGR